MNTLEILDKITEKSYYHGKSRIDAVRQMYFQYGLSVKQRRAVELFLFKPSEEQAIEILAISPKMLPFIQYALDDEIIVEKISDLIIQKKVNKRYLHELMNCMFRDLLEVLLLSPCGPLVEHYRKKYLMRTKLENKKVTD
ncbi:hypothetical protein MKZ20_03810 [Psychrobacillus sp. FSL K6-2684]|uniref:hypothetical protein n=1 Tax=Psychrobacillus sp. FSL K6-2684 TaxID=2921547 RepID=UPI0030F75C52